MKYEIIVDIAINTYNSGIGRWISKRKMFKWLKLFNEWTCCFGQLYKYILYYFHTDCSAHRVYYFNKSFIWDMSLTHITGRMQNKTSKKKTLRDKKLFYYKNVISNLHIIGHSIPIMMSLHTLIDCWGLTSEQQYFSYMYFQTITHFDIVIPFCI